MDKQWRKNYLRFITEILRPSKQYVEGLEVKFAKLDSKVEELTTNFQKLAVRVKMDASIISKFFE